MTIGLVGAHRVGKTTLAEAVSHETDLPLVITKTSDVFKKAGIDPSKTMNFRQRMEIQNLVLDAAVDLWRQEKGGFITDRTPVDMLGYTLADINNGTPLDDLEFELLRRYRMRCIDALNHYFSVIVLVQPGIPLVAAEGKASPNRGYIEHLNDLMFGIMMDPNIVCQKTYIRRDVLDLNERVRAVQNSISLANDRLLPETGQYIVH